MLRTGRIKVRSKASSKNRCKVRLGTKRSKNPALEEGEAEDEAAEGAVADLRHRPRERKRRRWNEEKEEEDEEEDDDGVFD